MSTPLERLILEKKEKQEKLLSFTAVALQNLPSLRETIRLQLKKAGLDGSSHNDKTQLIVHYEGWVYKIHSYVEMFGTPKMWYSRYPEGSDSDDVSATFCVSPGINSSQSNFFTCEIDISTVREYIFLLSLSETE